MKILQIKVGPKWEQECDIREFGERRGDCAKNRQFGCQQKTVRGSEHYRADKRFLVIIVNVTAIYGDNYS